VVTGEDAGLPPDYALLGKVTKGQDVVDKIGVQPVQPDEQPVNPVVIRQIRITES
jgi:cyclophilin family peptidyl-prolyl cis-trans isomerase